MDYFSKSQPIALPLTSDKEPLLVESAAQPPEAPTTSVSRRSRKCKLRKALAVFLFLAFIGFVFRSAHFAKKWFHRRGGVHPWNHGHFHHGPHHDHPHHGLHHCHHNQGPPPFARPPHFFGPVDVMQMPPPMFLDMSVPDHSDMQCETMANWSDPEENKDHRHGGPRFSSNTSFTFPLSSRSLLFYASGRYAAGNVVFVEDDTNTLPSGNIAVDIGVHYWNQEALDQAEVCALSRAVGDGLGIFTPKEGHRGRRHDELLFNIFVRIPKSSDDKPTHIKSFRSFLPMFAHHFTNANIHFEALRVISSNFPIVAESLNVGFGSLRTSNNFIVGNFTVSSSLELTTANSPITVNVTMNNADEKFPTRLVTSTGNAPLAADVSLFSTGQTGGAFTVDAHTYNSPLHVQFPIAPVDSLLHLSASTSNSPAFVALHPTYEGSFYVSSSILRPQLTVKEDVEDPKGQGRTRKVAFNAAGHEIAGDVSWEGGQLDSMLKGGRVEVTSSIISAHLIL